MGAMQVSQQVLRVAEPLSELAEEGGERDGGDVASDDLLVTDAKDRRTYSAGEYPLRFGKVIEVVRIAAAVGHGKPRESGTTARPPHALGVVKGFWRDVAQKDGIEIPQVYPQLERGRTTQDADLAFPELPLELPGLVGVELGSVFLDAELSRKRLLVEQAVVVRL